MPEELNQAASSQPATAAGTNAPGKPSEGVAASNMTASQATDYYNKTQQLAAERRAFEAEKARYEQERGRPAAPQGSGYGNPGAMPNAGYPGFQGNPGNFPQNPNSGMPQGNGWGAPNPGFQPAPVIPVSQEVIATLYKELGPEAAQAHLRSIQQATESVQRVLQAADQRWARAEGLSLLNALDARGRETYGQAWKEKSADVLKMVSETGQDLDYCWWKLNGGVAAIQQQATDAAYQQQQQKQEANVQQGNVQPNAQAPTEFKSVGDAFQAAWKEHQGA